jgi:hypothetical protein
MKDDTDEAVAEGAHALFFPCGTGHMLGLAVFTFPSGKYVGRKMAFYIHGFVPSWIKDHTELSFLPTFCP